MVYVLNSFVSFIKLFLLMLFWQKVPPVTFALYGKNYLLLSVLPLLPFKFVEHFSLPPYESN